MHRCYLHRCILDGLCHGCIQCICCDRRQYIPHGNFRTICHEQAFRTSHQHLLLLMHHESISGIVPHPGSTIHKSTCGVRARRFVERSSRLNELAVGGSSCAPAAAPAPPPGGERMARRSVAFEGSRVSRIGSARPCTRLCRSTRLTRPCRLLQLPGPHPLDLLWLACAVAWASGS